MKILFADRCEVLPEELKEFAADITHEFDREIRSWYFLAEIPYEWWNNGRGASHAQEEIFKLFYKMELEDNPSFININIDFHKGLLNHYCTWDKNGAVATRLETVYFKMRIRYNGDIENHKIGGRARYWYEWTNTANDIILNGLKGRTFTREHILNSFSYDIEQLWKDTKKYTEGWEEKYCDLLSWWYGNKHEIYENRNGWYVFHLQREDEENEDFLNFCRDQLSNTIIHKLETDIDRAKFYKISGSESKDAFTLKMFSV